MSSISTEFRATATQVQEGIDAVEIRDDFKPPCSPAGIAYNCLLSEVKADTGVRKQGPNAGNPYSWVLLEWTIQDGVYQGRKFVTFYSSDNPWFVGPLFSLASMLTQDQIYTQAQQFVESAEACAPFEGRAVLEILGVSKTRKSDGEIFSNYKMGRLISILDSEDAPIEADVVVT